MAIEIQKDVLLAPYTTFKIGGPARFFVEVENEKELIEALEYAKKNNFEYFILGGGSNILISDKGFDGMVIRLQNTKYEISANGGLAPGLQDADIECGAGALLSAIVSESVKNGLTGLEWAAGIPGTIGGAVRGNAGAFNGEMVQSVVSVRAINTLDSRVEIIKLTNEDCHFKYRSSIFKENKGWIIISVNLKLTKEINAGESSNRVKEIIQKRTGSSPKFPSAGSIFKNCITFDELKAHNKELADYIVQEGIVNRMGNVGTGFLIEYLDLKGKKIGGAEVSTVHGNFIINNGNATAEDVIMLINFIKQQVRTKLGIQLQEEVQLVGF